MTPLTFHTIHWLPRHLAEMVEWQEICKAYDYLLSQAADTLDEIQMNEFLDSLTEIGCEIWERFLGITVVPGETVEERRQTIQSFCDGDLPYTENKLRETLESITGAENVKLTVTESTFTIRVDLYVNSPSMLANTQQIVYKMRPCNMIVRILVNYRYRETVYVGLATKMTKELYPVDYDVEDPLDGVDWYVIDDEGEDPDEDGILLVNELGETLIV